MTKGLILDEGVWKTPAQMKREQTSAERAMKATEKKAAKTGAGFPAPKKRVAKRGAARVATIDVSGWYRSIIMRVASEMSKAGQTGVQLTAPCEPKDAWEINSSQGSLRIRMVGCQDKKLGPCLRFSCTSRKWTGKKKPKTRSVKQPLLPNGKIDGSALAKSIFDTCTF